MAVITSKVVQLPDLVNYVPYIQSSGTQYIKTGIYASAANTKKLRLVVDTEILNTGSAWRVHGTGAGGASTFYVGVNSGVVRYGGGNENMNAGWTYTYGTRVVFDLDAAAGTFSASGLGSTTYTPVDPTGSVEFYLFAFNSDTAANCHSSKLYSCQIYESGALVRDFWPCYDPDGVLCLYDKVEGKYYYNAGTGSFVTDGSTAEPTTHKVTLVGAFDSSQLSSKVYVQIDGTRYGAAGTVEAKDLATVTVYVNGSGASIVYLNGSTVLADYGGSLRGYTFALRKNCTIKDATVSEGYALAEITM